jgi:anti-sigma factor RsiW
MRDCPNATMRDRLPDLLHDRLSTAERAEVRAHVAACPDCRAELALLERIRESAVVRRVDATRIVAALPAYRSPAWPHRAIRSPQLRVAAAIVALAGAAAVFMGRMAVDPTSSDPVAQAPVAAPATVVSTPAPDTPVARTTELAVGELLQDLSDAELQALLDELETFEAVTPAETEVVLPALGRGAS